MNTHANTSWFAASLRRLAAVFAMLFLLASLLPSHVDARILATDYGSVAASALQNANDDQPQLPDGMPGHIVGQCACSITVLPDVMAQPGSLLIRPVRFAMRTTPFVPLGGQAPPFEPPRT